MTYKAITNNNYIVDQDGSGNVTHDPIDLANPNASLCFQFKWDETIDGKFIFEATVYNKGQELWTPLVACEAVEFETISATGYNNIVTIPDIWKLVSKIRIRYEAKAGSTGNYSCAVRVVPI